MKITIPKNITTASTEVSLWQNEPSKISKIVEIRPLVCVGLVFRRNPEVILNLRTRSGRNIPRHSLLTLVLMAGNLPLEAATFSYASYQSLSLAQQIDELYRHATIIGTSVPIVLTHRDALELYLQSAWRIDTSKMEFVIQALEVPRAEAQDAIDAGYDLRSRVS